MKRRTVIISKTNDDHTAYIMNYGIDELDLFKKMKDNGVELQNEEMLSDEEIRMLLGYCCKDAIIEGVFSIENHFNRDQRQINIIKRNLEEKLKFKGYEIVTHCDWKPSFSYEPGVINTRNYLTILMKNIDDKKLEKRELIEEVKLLEEEKKNNTEKIRNQNWYIEHTKTTEEEYNQWNEKLLKVIERYKKGEEICKNQEREAKEKWPKELKELEEDINIKKNELNDLKRKIDELKYNIKDIEPKYVYMKNEMVKYEEILDQILQKY